jgi:transcription antitermination factor NusG
MSSAPQIDTHRTSKAPLSDSLAQAHWYAAYTAANHEKKIAAELQRRSVECFLPLYESFRRWRDRRVKLQMPLFPGYIFVHLPLLEKLRVLQIPGVVHLVSFSEGPAQVPQSEITSIQNILRQGLPVEPYPYLSVGRRVRVNAGPLNGLEGIVVRRKNKLRFVVLIELIQRAMSVELGQEDLTPVSARA